MSSNHGVGAGGGSKARRGRRYRSSRYSSDSSSSSSSYTAGNHGPRKYATLASFSRTKASRYRIQSSKRAKDSSKSHDEREPDRDNPIPRTLTSSTSGKEELIRRRTKNHHKSSDCILTEKPSTALSTSSSSGISALKSRKNRVRSSEKLETRGHYSEGETLSLKNWKPLKGNIPPRRSLGNEEEVALSRSNPEESSKLTTKKKEEVSKHLDDVFASLEKSQQKTKTEVKTSPKIMASDSRPAPTLSSSTSGDREVLDFTSNRKKLLEMEKMELMKLKEQHHKSKSSDFVARLAAMSIPGKSEGTTKKLDVLGRSNEADSEGEGGEVSSESKKVQKRMHRRGYNICTSSSCYNKGGSKSNFSSPVLSSVMPPSVQRNSSDAREGGSLKSALDRSEIQEYLKRISKGNLTGSDIALLQSMGIQIYQSPSQSSQPSRSHKRPAGSSSSTLSRSLRSQSHEFLLDDDNALKEVKDHHRSSPKQRSSAKIPVTAQDKSDAMKKKSASLRHAWTETERIDPPELFNTSKASYSRSYTAQELPPKRKGDPRLEKELAIRENERRFARLVCSCADRYKFSGQ